MKYKTRKILIAALSLTMAATITTSQIVTFAKEGNGSALSSEYVQEASFTELTGSIDLSDVVRDNLSEQVVDYGEEEEIRNITGQSVVKTVMISLDTESVAQSKGDDMTVAEFLGTSAGEKALRNVQNSQNKLLSDLGAAGISYKLVNRYTTVLNAVAIEVNTSQFDKIKKLPGVSMAGISKTYAALSVQDAVVNPNKVYGTGIYDSTEFLDRYDGSGVTVAVLDTGIDYTHEAFSHDPEEVSFDRSHISDRLSSLAAAERTPGLTVDDVYLSAKIPFAYDYADNDTDVYPSYSQHGVHVAGIVAGKAETYVNKDGVEIDDPTVEYDFMGVAPEAQLVICKVFTDDLNSDDLGGATSEDVVAALDDCVKLGVDIINMSLGTTSGFGNVTIDGDQEGAMLNTCYQTIKEEGISLIAAAGNEYSSGFGSEFGTNLASNPDSGTVGSPSTFVGSMSVASINGQQAPYLVANPGEDSAYGDSPIYYNESSDANSVPYDFAEEMLGSKQSETFTYLVIPGTGSPGDYSLSVQRRLTPVSEGGLKQEGEKIIVLVKRGTLDFQTKVENAQKMHADGIIIYNNVPGTIRMSLGEIKEEERIPAISIDMDAGALLTTDPSNPLRLRSEGTITIDKSNLAGPFMNDYSSWGATPDLKLKPDITAHGGEITSSVSGGYEEMSGTSMATPNLAGLMALVKNYLRDEHGITDAKQLTRLTNQIVMSSATLLYDEQGLPYSPRKQGAGLATLSNIFNTKAYLATTLTEEEGGTEDFRPKVELGEDENKTGVYSFTFSVTNFGEQALSFKLVSRFFTETLASDGLAVAEAAYMLDDIAPVFTVNGASYDGNILTIGGNKTATIDVTLRLSDDEKTYIDRSFVNGMFVEGFISLESQDGTGVQCDLNLPFMGFYGDWEAAPMLDYNAYEISAIEQDTSLTDAEKPHESVFATQLFSTYYNGRYAVPMGGYVYLQDDSAEQVYVTEEHCAISRFNIYNGPTATDNYMTSTGIRALYAGLLRNAELVTYDIYDVNTGELVVQGEKYRIGKAYAGGGSAHPALVDLKLDPDTLGLINNGKYSMEFNFYMKAEEKGTDVAYDNNFTSTFYVDYDAPILESSRIVYRDTKDGNKIRQKVYLELDIYDNHYPQSVLLCYSNEEYEEGESTEGLVINLATEYVTPIYNPGRNTTTTVSIEITDIYEQYRNRMYVQLDDYALNHSVYGINFSLSNGNGAEDDFDFVLNDRVTRTQSGAGNYTYNLTIEKNEAYRVELNCGDANASNYTWSTPDGNRILIKGNEIFGLSPTTNRPATVTVKSGSKSLTLNVTVVDSNRTLDNPILSFGVIQNANRALSKASGTVEVNAGQTFKLEVESDPWYYPVSDLTFTWESLNEEIATVDQNGTVTTNNKRGTADIRASAVLPNGTTVRAVVKLSVQEPFSISSMTLTKYYGSEEIVIIPNDKNVMYIGEEAFEDNDTMKAVVIPRTVVEISERAFLNCTALEEIYFVTGPTPELCPEDETDYPVVKKSSLNLILADAFQGCTSLRYIDLTNVKVITVADTVFDGCESLGEIEHMENIGIAGNFAFRGTALKEIDITGLHTAGYNVFEGCTQLESIITGQYTAISEGMFYGCTKLEQVTINTPKVSGVARMMNMIGGGAFENCTSLTTVTFGGAETRANTVFRIDPYAFAGCSNLSTVNFGENYTVSYIGDYAFANTNITTFKMPNGNPELGNNVFDGTSVEIDWGNDIGTEDGTYGAIYRGTTLVLAPAHITSSFEILDSTTEIAPYAFASSTFDSAVTTINLKNVTKIGEGAFYGTPITAINLTSVTEIAPYTFAYTGLRNISVPASVALIGEGAFMGSALETITFNGTSLKTIEDYAFSGTQLIAVTLPDGVTAMGSYVFSECAELVEANLSSLQSLGDYTFIDCPELATVKFGANATASGNYTFFPGSHYEIMANKIVEVYHRSSLSSVDLGGLTELGEGVFWYCKSLEEIDLKNVTKIGMGAFAECSLTKVDGLENVTYIGDVAFAENTNLAVLNLENAVEIGAQAFYNVDATTLTIPKAEKIGAQAFAGITIRALEIPATLKELGAGAFMSAGYLRTVTVEDGNPVFFAEDNVLYRIITNTKTGAADTYELCLYPAARVADNKEYSVIEGTVSVQGWSFAYLNQNALEKVILPYSVKLIGSSAFYISGISTYNFESIVAPTLLSETYDLTQVDPTNIYVSAFRSLYYRNFNEELIKYVTSVGFNGSSTTTIAYPSNGTGYDNYVYSLYFANHVSLGELIDDNTRALIALINGFDIETVRSWLNLNSDDADNIAMVEAFSAQVKEAHRMYNNTASAVQLGFLNEGEDRAAKLLAVEEALKPVKERFGIKINVTSVAVDASSGHKSEYTVGDRFEMAGLVIKITYDDYSSEVISDLTNVVLSSSYNRALYTYDTFVSMEYQGIVFRVPITVKAESTDTPVNPGDEGDKNPDKENPNPETPGDDNGGSGCAGGCGGMDINSTLGGTGLVLLTLAGAMVVMHKLRRRANK